MPSGTDENVKLAAKMPDRERADYISEYISQLERDLAFKTIETRKLRTEIAALTQKVEECRSSIVALLRHPALSDYYEWHQ